MPRAWIVIYVCPLCNRGQAAASAPDERSVTRSPFNSPTYEIYRPCSKCTKLIASIRHGLSGF